MKVTISDQLCEVKVLDRSWRGVIDYDGALFKLDLRSEMGEPVLQLNQDKDSFRSRVYRVTIPLVNPTSRIFHRKWALSGPQFLLSDDETIRMAVMEPRMSVLFGNGLTKQRFSIFKDADLVGECITNVEGSAVTYSLNLEPEELDEKSLRWAAALIIAFNRGDTVS